MNICGLLELVFEFFPERGWQSCRHTPHSASSSWSTPSPTVGLGSLYMFTNLVSMNWHPTVVLIYLNRLLVILSIFIEHLGFLFHKISFHVFYPFLYSFMFIQERSLYILISKRKLLYPLQIFFPVFRMSFDQL